MRAADRPRWPTREQSEGEPSWPARRLARLPLDLIRFALLLLPLPLLLSVLSERNSIVTEAA
jgi:hypothetical protein